MTAWTEGELLLLDGAHSLVLSVGDGTHPGVEVGMVVVRGDLHVRAARGTTSRWYRAAQEHGHGRVRVGDRDWDVLVETGGDRPAGAVDAAYRAKYGASAALLAAPRSQAATLRIRPAHPGPMRLAED
ncbi:DUF2255 family protein [Kitasatospora sp. NPDC057223]|uniref:DUF2255 family protein n=1 Tax=Kitasatospora sp. NPDC057223 TaxID=3346055 RepID=UPI003626FA31